jgi:hypothetical protein
MPYVRIGRHVFDTAKVVRYVVEEDRLTIAAAASLNQPHGNPRQVTVMFAGVSTLRLRLDDAAAFIAQVEPLFNVQDLNAKATPSAGGGSS